MSTCTNSDSSKLKELYIRACRAFKNRPAMHGQVLIDLSAAYMRNEITKSDYEIVKQVHKSVAI
jgi:hypothetical protein